MPLADYQPERVRIDHRGKPLTEVRGLNLEDISVLVRSHLTELQVLYARFQNTALDTEALIQIISEAPGIAARVIALASDEPEGVAAARKFSLPLQVKMLAEIVRLTFEDVGGPKAFVALVGQLAGVHLLPDGEPATIQ